MRYDRVSVILLLSGWLSVSLSAQQPGSEGSLRASLDREVKRLIAASVAADDLSSKRSTAFSIPAAQARGTDDWGAVRRLEQGTRVRLTTRQGRVVTGMLTAVSEDAVQIDGITSIPRDDVQDVHLPHTLSVGGYTGLGLLLGGVAGLIAGSNAGCKSDCDPGDSGLAAVGGLYLGVLWGGMGGFITGQVVHHRPERLVYARLNPASR